MNKIEKCKKTGYMEFLKRLGTCKKDKNGMIDIDLVSCPSTPNIYLIKS